jgi:phosphoglycolate phosphatase-like HAD superfamily hydrolase
MMASMPTILALDFDGVICDGLIEYFQTAWRTYCQIWSPASQIPPDDLATNFYRLRPVIETGWEMPVLIRALLLGISEEKILQEWATIAQNLLEEAGLVAADIGRRLDQIRDEWIATDLANWLSLHRFYPGVVERLQSLVISPVQLVIVTTKEGRFVRQLLQQQGIQMPNEGIIGKSKRPKHQIIRELITVIDETPPSLWFVEDRLKTLQLVQQQLDLDAVKLYLADWGYNTAPERESARYDPQIHLLSLSQFAQDFPAWS